MEDNVGSDQDVMNVLPRFRSGIDAITVVRSISDAVEPGNKYSSLRRSNGFLRRPEILETVYSVEEVSQLTQHRRRRLNQAAKKILL